MRNYEMIHLIQSAGLPKNAQQVVVRAFNKMYDNRDYDGCLATSVSLCLALEYIGYVPQLCIGKVYTKHLVFYHAWTELDGRVIDVSIFGNSSFTPNWTDEVIKPQVYKAYFETDIKYHPFEFDKSFQCAKISRGMGLTFFSYCENAPRFNAMWNQILYYLDTSSLDVLNTIKSNAKNHTIGERNTNDA